MVERELLMSKFWQAESMSSQLHDMNRQLFSEIDHLQVSLLKLSHGGGGSSDQNFAALNPFLSHFSQLKSIYE